tara:strand:- start:329 stop:496 length:168 start_codon:yes stop_codon:yes gene_type:complete
MSKKDSFNSKTSTNGQVNDNEGIIEKIFKLPYRTLDVYKTIKNKRKKEKEMYGDQ